MKKQVALLVVMLGVAMVGESVAQSLRMKANIPFDFVVNGSTLPAGEYTIQSFGVADGKTLRVGSISSHQGALVNAIDVDKGDLAQSTKLVFHRYGNRYFLSQVWVRGDERGRELPKSHRESELAKDYRSTFQEVDLVATLQ